jgi:hypothetical protein
MTVFRDVLEDSGAELRGDPSSGSDAEYYIRGLDTTVRAWQPLGNQLNMSFMPITNVPIGDWFPVSPAEATRFRDPAFHPSQFVYVPPVAGFPVPNNNNITLRLRGDGPVIMGVIRHRSEAGGNSLTFTVTGDASVERLMNHLDEFIALLPPPPQPAPVRSDSPRDPLWDAILMDYY